MQVSSTFLAITLQLLIADRATIPHMKEDIQDFHMTPNIQIFIGEIGLFRDHSHSKPVAPRTVKIA